jgi:NTE family protein
MAMDTTAAVLPVHFIPGDSEVDNPRDGTGLCLSGGGFRAMLFHAGALWRLNEAGLLPTLTRVSSVSGGSITNAVLGLAWRRLAFGADGISPVLEREVIAPIRDFAERTFDWRAIVGGLLLPGGAGDRMVGFYREHLFGEQTLQDLPDDAAGEGPRFIFNATNLQSGVLWRFSRPYMADYRVGRRPNPRVEIAVAVAASAGFPPLLSPITLELAEGELELDEGNDLHEPPYTTRIDLADGGIYDNLGLETVLKRYRTVLVSDGGGHLGPVADPPDDWIRQSQRVIGVVDSQVRSLRKRLLIEAYKREAGTPGAREGAYWGIWTDIADYGLANSLPCDLAQTTLLAQTSTRLAKLDDLHQERLINWGYAVCDAALRSFVNRLLPAPADFPYPRAGIG